MRQVHLVTDLQFGSTGKGLFCGYLAKRVRPDTLVTAWGPNSGHTFVGKDGEKHVNIMIPSGVVSDSVKQILLGPGSIIDCERLLDEMTRYALFDSSRIKLAIHENAAVVGEMHRLREAKYGFGIGSTMKGVGEALMDKISRKVGNVAGNALQGTPLEGFLVGVKDYNDLLDSAKIIQVEGAQGFSLSINQGFYPYCTSRDCTTAQVMSDCGIPAARGWGDWTVYGVARTYPIRVANRYKECGCNGTGSLTPNLSIDDPDYTVCPPCMGMGRIQVGTSGPCYSDQREIAWADLGLEPELTTVTKLPRRLFTFSEEQVRQAIRMNGVDYVFLNFCNYVADPHGVDGMIAKIEAAGAIVRWTGWGERESLIQQVRRAA